MPTLFADESGNVFHPAGPEVIAFAGVCAGGSGLRLLRQHADKARRRAATPSTELRFRSADRRSTRFFFSRERLAGLPIRAVAVATQIGDMAAFRAKNSGQALYEHLLGELVHLARIALPEAPTTVHVDPSSGFVSRQEFARRIGRHYPDCAVVFAPDSVIEKGLQAADMAAGAFRKHLLQRGSVEWNALVGECGAVCRIVPEHEVRRVLGGNEGRAGVPPVRVSSSGS